MRNKTVLVLAVALVACKGKGKDDEAAPAPAKPVPPPAEKTAYEPVPAGSAFSDPAIAQFAIYYLPKPKGDPKVALKNIVAKSYSYIRITDKKDDGPFPLVHVGEPAIADYSPPDEESLEFFGRGLDAKQKKAVQASRHVLVLTFVAGGEERLRVARDAMRLALELARTTGGLLWDEDSRELYSLDSWQKRVDTWTGAAPVAARLFAVHSYRDGELVRMVSVGMGKLGLPDLVVNQVSMGSAEAMGSLINLVAQTLVEGGEVGEGGRLAVDVNSLKGSFELLDGAVGKATVTLAVGERQEGDSENRLWEIAFPGRAGDSLQVRQNAVLDRLFGSKEEIYGVKSDDPELEAARARAQRALMSLKPSVQKGLPERERLLVKAPFRTDDGGTEWMWVEVLEWKGKQIAGILQNKPRDVSSLEAGARVEVEEGSVFDYIRVHADGSREGNETGEIIMRRQSAAGR